MKNAEQEYKVEQECVMYRGDRYPMSTTAAVQLGRGNSEPTLHVRTSLVSTNSFCFTKFEHYNHAIIPFTETENSQTSSMRCSGSAQNPHMGIKYLISPPARIELLYSFPCLLPFLIPNFHNAPRCIHALKDTLTGLSDSHARIHLWILLGRQSRRHSFHECKQVVWISNTSRTKSFTSE